MLKVTMLQTPSILLDGQPVSLPFKRADALLYYMLVQRSATRQELIALLWENRDEATGLKNLRNTLYVLKKALGGDLLISPQKSLVVVNQDWEIDCDYERFTQQKDFSAYQGPFLQGFAVKHAIAFDEWLERTRERLHEQYLDHLVQQARDAHAAGEKEESIRLATEYLREEPFDEAMVAFLMECFQEEQKYSKAVQVYKKLKEQLLEELGTDPLESTTMLYYQIMNQWSDTSQTARENGLQIPVGRESTYAALRAAADSFMEGAARRCSQLLVGEVGSGKSCLIECFLRWTDLSPLLVLQCGCRQSEEGLPLAPWNRIMLDLWEFLQEERISLPLALQARLGQTFPFFQPEDSGAGGHAAQTLRYWGHSLQDSMVLLFSTVIRRKKVLLLMEDLQWVDQESFLLVDTLLRRLKDGGFMAVFTCRNSLSPRVQERLRGLESDGLLHRRCLYPLTAQETEQMLERELGAEAAQRMAPQFYRETGGNLYLLTELTQAYRRSGNVEATIQTLGEILMERLSGLSEDAMHVAQLISLFQEEVPSRLLLGLMEEDDRRLTAALEELHSRGIIEEHRDEWDAAYGFVHQRIRELIYGCLTTYQRQPLHQRAAELLAELEPPRDGRACRQIARHFQLAGDRLGALKYQVRALDLDSARVCAPFSQFGGDVPLTIPVKELEESAQACLTELSELRRDGVDPAALAALVRWVTLSLGRIELFQGRATQGVDRLSELSGGVSNEENRIAIQACYLLAYMAVYRQECEQAERYTATGARLLERMNNPVGQAQFQCLRGSCFRLRGEYNKSRYYLQEAVDTLERQPRSTSVRLQLVAAYSDYGKVYCQCQEYAEACSYYKRALAMMEDGPWPGGVWVYVHYGRAAFELEDHAKAKELFLRGYQDAKVTGEPWGRTAAAAYTAYYQMLDGDYHGAAESLKDAQDSQTCLESHLEGTILCFVSMHIRCRMEREHRMDTPLAALVPELPEDYARQGIRLAARIPNVFEAERLAQSLRDGITTRVHYRVAELYSKNKNYVAE